MIAYHEPPVYSSISGWEEFAPPTSPTAQQLINASDAKQRALLHWTAHGVQPAPIVFNRTPDPPAIVRARHAIELRMTPLGLVLCAR